MKSLFLRLIVSLVGASCLWAQASVPINTIASSHPTEVVPPIPSSISVEGRWRLTKYTRTPPVVDLDSEFGVIMAFVTPDQYVGQVVCKDNEVFGTSRKQAHGRAFECRKYKWVPNPAEHQPGPAGGSGTIGGRLDLMAWIELASGDGSASLDAALSVSCPELSAYGQLGSTHIRTTQKKSIGRAGVTGGGMMANISIDTALRNGFYPGPAVNPELFGGMKDNLSCCTVLQAAAVTVDAFADGHILKTAVVRAFGQGGSTFALELN